MSSNSELGEDRGVIVDFPPYFAANIESISLMSACCSLIFSPFPRLELRKNTLNSFVQILNLTVGASFVSVSGFRSTLIFTLSVSCACSTRIGVVSLGAKSRQSVTSLSNLACSIVMLSIS